jgi:P4 family phage/plasmid primase-like protien
MINKDDGITLEQLEATAALAPKEAQPVTGDYSSQGETPNSGGYTRSDLGPLDVGRYLEHYGQEYRLQQEGSLKKYLLKSCVFDPNHKGKDAMISQDPSGLITYHCFHNSCSNKTWAGARMMISGRDKLPQFCAGYDPNRRMKKPAPRSTLPDQPGDSSDQGDISELGSGILNSIEVEYSAPIGVPAAPAFPPPDKIDPREFYRKNMQGKVAFIPLRMAKYYVGYLGHLAHTADTFWHYQAGVWRRFSSSDLMKICVAALGDAVQATHLDGTIKILRGLINKEHNEWPKWAGHINCLNGMVNIETGKLEPHDPKYGSMSQIPCEYSWDDFDARLEDWLKILNGMFPGEEGKKSALQQFLGYCYVPDCRYEKALFMYGEGGNGKGTVIEAFRSVLGEENCASLTMEHISDPKFSLYFLQGKLMNLTPELSSRKGVETEMFKQIVSGEPLTVERKYGDKYEFNPYVKMIIAMNDLPIITDTSYGMKRRLIVVNFNQKFEQGKNADTDLKELLKTDQQLRNAIFMWGLLGLQSLIKNKQFILDHQILDDVDKFFKGMDPTSEFLDESVEDGEGHGAVPVQELYEDYDKWCKNTGHNKLNRRNFNKRVQRIYPALTKGLWGQFRRMHWIGLQRKSGAQSGAA